MKIAVHGSYFMRNFGDTLLIKTACDWIKEMGYDDIILPTVSSDKEAEEIGAKRVSQDEWGEIDLLLYAGGGYFGEPNSDFIGRNRWAYLNYKRHVKLYQALNPKNTIVFGLGFGPISNPYLRKKVINIFKSSRLVYLRDEESMEYAKKYKYTRGNLNRGVDLALSVGLEKKIYQPSKNNVIGLHIPIVDKKLVNKYYLLFQNVINIGSVEIFCDAPKQTDLINHEDSFNYRLLKRHNIKINPYQGPEELINNLRRCRLIVTSKLHVGILAASMGIPVYSVPIHTKVERFYKQINYMEQCNPIYQFDIQKHENIISNITKLRAANISPEISNILFSMKENLKSSLNEIKKT